MRKNYFAAIFSAALILIGLSACNQKDEVWFNPSDKYTSSTLNKQNSVFEEITVSGSLDVKYQSNTEGSYYVHVYGPDNVIEHVKAVISDKHLDLSIDDMYCRGNGSVITVFVSCPDLKAATITGSGDLKILGSLKGENTTINISGSGDIEHEGVLKCKNLMVNMSGTGDMNLEFAECENIKISNSGGGDIVIKNATIGNATITLDGTGDISIKGSSNMARLESTSTGDIIASNFVAATLTAKLSGTGDIYCSVTNTLSATVNGSGTIYYHGNPPQKSISGRESGVKSY